MNRQAIEMASDFKSDASTSFATPAPVWGTHCTRFAPGLHQAYAANAVEKFRTAFRSEGLTLTYFIVTAMDL